MKISCSTAAFIDPKSSVEEKLRASIEALNTIVNYGYDGIELFIPKVFNEEQNDILFKEAEKIKGKILSMHAPKNTLHRPAKEIFPSLSRLIKRAGELETKIIVLHPPFQKDFSSLLRKVFFIFDKLINYAQKNNVILTIENVPYLLDPPIFYEELTKRYSEGIGITIDIEYLHSTPYSLEKYPTELLTNFLKNIHIRDYDGHSFDDEGRRRYLQLGKGNIDFKKIFKKLSELNYKGPVTVETVFNNEPDDLIYCQDFILKNLS